MLEAASQRPGIVTHHSSVLSLRWIINAREDLVWFIGSVASSYALLVLYTQGVVPLVPMVALWAILIDAPHVFGTFSRTYFDRTERRDRTRLLWGSLLFFIVGPVLVALGAGLVFFFLAALWVREFLVDEGGVLAVVITQIATFKNAHPHACDVAGGHSVHVGADVFALLGLMAFDRNGGIPFKAMHLCNVPAVPFK